MELVGYYIDGPNQELERENHRQNHRERLRHNKSEHQRMSRTIDFGHTQRKRESENEHENRS